MKNTKRVAANTLILTTTEIIIKASGFIWFLIIANILTTDGYGIYALVNSFVALFALFPEIGSGIVIIREIAGGKDINKVISSAIVITSIMSVLTIIAIIISSVFLQMNTDTRTALIIASLTLALSALRSSAMFYFDGKENFKISSILNITNTLLMILAAATLLIAGYGVLGVFTGMLAGTFISTIITWTTFLKKHHKFTFTPVISNIKSILRISIPLGLAGASYMIYTRIDSVMISQFTNLTEVATYNSATPFIVATIQLLNVPFAVASFPTLTKIHSTDKKRFKKAVAKSMMFVTFWSIPVALAILLFADDIFPLLFGGKYDSAIPVLKYLAFFIPFASLSAILYKILIILNRQDIYLIISVVAVIVNITLNLFLIPQYGIIGAAISSVATQAAAFMIYALFTFTSLRKL